MTSQHDERLTAIHLLRAGHSAVSWRVLKPKVRGMG